MKKAIRQTYWPKRMQRVPIPKQRNDDDRMGYNQKEYLKNQLKWLKENRDDRMSNRARNQIENELRDLERQNKFR